MSEQQVKQQSADLADLGSRLAVGGTLFNHKRGSVARNLSISPIHHPDTTEKLLKRM